MTAQSTAVVPYRGRSGKVVQFAADGVAADVRVEPLDRHRRTNAYTIRLASTDADTWGRLVGVLASGDVVDLGSVAVSRGSVGVATCAVTAPSAGYRAVYLEIRSDQVLLQVEAPKPPRPRRFDPLGAMGAVVGGGAIAAGVTAFALAMPQTPLLQAPERAIAGHPISVPYATRGYGDADYVARFDDGVVFASGTLPAKSGALALPLPPDTANRRVFVALSLHGPLGSASTVASFNVAPPPPLRVAEVPARVLSFAARRDPSPWGETVLASYLAVADRGVVVLQDRRGRVVASAPFSHVGTNRLTVAGSYRDQPLTARITVDHGKTRAVASLALPPGTQAVSTSLPRPAGSAAGAPVGRAVTNVAETNAGMLDVEGRAIAGAPLTLRVMPQTSPMSVALQNGSGETLAERAIAAGTTRISVPLPQEPATYFLVLRYDRNGSEETVVRPLRTFAAGAQTSSR